MNIIFIDDEQEQIEVYKEDLDIAAREKGNILLRILMFDNLQKAYQYIKENFNNIDIIILDIMMPGGDEFHEKDEDPMGLKSGIYFYQEVKRICPNLDIRFFTNVTNLEMEKLIGSDTVIYYKDQLLPFELTKEILG